MRNLLLFLMIFLTGSPSWATWGLLSSVAKTAGPGGTTSAIDTSTSGPATLLVACLDCYNAGTGATCSISDSANNGWTLSTSQVQGTETFELYYSSNPSVSTTHTFTSHGSSGGSQDTYGFQVGAFTGAQTSPNPFDQTASAQGSGITTLAAGSITPSVTGELLVACIQGGASWTTNSLTINNGTVALHQDTFVGGVNYNNGFAWYSDPASSAINQTFSWTTSSSVLNAGVASFKPASGVNPAAYTNWFFF